MDHYASAPLIKSAYFWSSTAVVLFLIAVIAFYWFKWRFDTTPILQVLAILIVNQILESLFELLSYIDYTDPIICKVSLLGRLAFTVAANFWIIFITRLIYQEALAPGKYLNLVKFMFKNIIFAYIPSLVISTFLLVVLLVEDTSSEKNCMDFTQKQTVDYIVYAISFYLPSVTTSLILLVYLGLYFRKAARKWTIYLCFPIIALLFSAYYIAVKTVLMLRKAGSHRMEALEIPFLVEPVVFAVIFICIYKQQKSRVLHSSSLTIDDSQEISFIEEL